MKPESESTDLATAESGLKVPLSPIERFKVIEERRKTAEGVLWQLPALSLAAQAFLLNAGLNPDAKQWAQISVGLVGIAAVVTTGAVVLFQAVRATTLGHWVERTQDESLAAEALGKDDPTLSGTQKRLLKRRNVFYYPWLVALTAFLVVDGYVFARGLGIHG